MKSNSLKVLYIDDTPKDIENYGAIWKDLLEESGFKDVEFRSSLEFDLKLVDQQLPHLVIADNVLFLEETNEELDDEGCLLIAQIKKKYEHIVCVLLTEATFSIKTLGQLTPNPDLLIPKPHFRSREYRSDWIGPKIKKLLMRRPIGDVIFEDPELISEYKDLFPAIECILEQCLNDVSSYESGLSAQIKLSRLTGGVSGASVFLMQILGMERFNNVPLVFRLSNSTYIAEEIKNYKRFVSLQVPHDLRVELVGFGSHSESAGAIYAFALADVKNTTTALSLLSSITDNQSSSLESILEKIFARPNLGWYSTDNIGAVNLIDYFSDREEYKPEKDHRRIRGISKNIKKFDMSHHAINGDHISSDRYKLPLPRNIMGKLSGLNIKRTVVHGDLNLNNIIISENDQRLALIDFEYSGIDHVFKDFVSLEVSTLELYKHFNCFDRALDFFRARHSTDNFWEKNDDLIGNIRIVAKSKFSDASESPEISYLLCLAFHLFKVAALNTIDKKYFVTMLASLCAALERLDRTSK